MARRQVLVDNLRKQVANLTSTTDQKANDMGQHNMQAVSDVEPPGYISDSHHKTSYNPVATSEAGLTGRIMEMTGMQDSILSEIGTGVDRLSHLAHELHAFFLNTSFVFLNTSCSY